MWMKSHLWGRWISKKNPVIQCGTYVWLAIYSLFCWIPQFLLLTDPQDVVSSHVFFVKWLWINTYRYSLLGDGHPFTSYFDVNYRGTWFWPIPKCHFQRTSKILSGSNHEPVIRTFPGAHGFRKKRLPGQVFIPWNSAKNHWISLNHICEMDLSGLYHPWCWYIC